jgi:hypothetical protein
MPNRKTPTPPTRKYVTMSVGLPPEVYEKIMTLADEAGLGIAEWCRKYLPKFLRDVEAHGPDSASMRIAAPSEPPPPARTNESGVRARISVEAAREQLAAATLGMSVEDLRRVTLHAAVNSVLERVAATARAPASEPPVAAVPRPRGRPRKIG